MGIPTEIFSACGGARDVIGGAENYGAQHSDPGSLLWLVAGDQAVDGGSQRDAGLPQEYGGTDQPRRHASPHQAARRADAPGDLLPQPARQTRRGDARRGRRVALRSGWPCDAGTAIHQPYDPGADDQDRRGEAAVSVDHEHAAIALSETNSGAGGDGSGGGLHQCPDLGTVHAGPGDAVLARSAGLPSAGRGGQCASCRPRH